MRRTSTLIVEMNQSRVHGKARVFGAPDWVCCGERDAKLTLRSASRAIEPSQPTSRAPSCEGSRM